MTSASSYEHLILALESTHNTANYINGVSVLIRILDNIIAEPHNDKYRTIRLENKVVKEKLLALSGVRELLHAIGFVEVCTHMNAIFLLELASHKLCHYLLSLPNVATISDYSLLRCCAHTLLAQINGALSLPATVLIVSVRQTRDQLKRRMDAVGQSGANGN